MWKKSKITDLTATGQAGFKKTSRLPGVMVTQYVEELPRGASTPDFLRKPTAVTVLEGKKVIFKARVCGAPKPEVTWRRHRGDMSDKEKYLNTFDEATGEYTLQIPRVSGEEADTYKCYAVNDYGKAVVTAALNVIEVGFKKKKAIEELEAETTNPTEFRKLLKRARLGKQEEKKRDPGEVDERFWEIIMSADRKDYERICTEYGVKDFRLMLKRISERKKERQEEQSKDGAMIPYSVNREMKQSLKTVGKRLIFIIQDLCPEEAALYQVDAGEGNLFSTDFKISNVDFIIKIQDVKALEREDALFECVLSHPLPRIKWTAKSSPLESGDKYAITVSPDKLIHRLLVKDCLQLDKGIYAAVAGVKTSSAWLVIEADHDGGRVGKRKARKTTRAGGSGLHLEQVAREQMAKIQREKEEKIEAFMKARKEAMLQAQKAKQLLSTPSGAGEKTMGTRLGKDNGDGLNKSKAGGSEKPKDVKEHKVVKTVGDGDGLKGSGDARKASGDGIKCPGVGLKGSGNGLESSGDGLKDACDGIKVSDGGIEGPDHVRKGTGDALKGPGDGIVMKAMEAPNIYESQNKKRTKTGPEVLDKDAGDGDRSGRKGCTGSLVPDTVTDPRVQFVTGLFNVNAIIGQPAELTCKVSSDNCDGVWFKDGKKLTAKDGGTISKEGATHKLVIDCCQEEHSGIYRFEADGRKTEAVLHVQDPPRFEAGDLEKFSQPVIVRAGQHATFKLPFLGIQPMKIQWYREGLELLDENNVKIEKSSSHSRLLLSKCQRKQTGEIKMKLKNEHGTVEALTELIVLDKPTPPQGPVEVVESSATCIDIKWRPPKDDGGSPVKSYSLERRQVGRNTWKKLGELDGVPAYRDTDVDRGRKYCYRICAVTEEGTSEAMETADITAGTLAFAKAPAPPKVGSAFKDCINLTWAPPSNTGGYRIFGYNLEKRKKGSNLWSPVNPTDEPIRENKYAVKDVVAGIEYEFRISAINVSGVGEPSNPSEFVFARDPKKPPGKVVELKVTETTYTSLSLSWTKPTEEKGVQDEAKGYFVEVRPAECIDWTRCNSNTTPIFMNVFTVKSLKPMSMYWVRVIATNEGGEGLPQDLDNYIIAMPSPVRPRFKSNKTKSFVVVRAGNSVRIALNFEASPWPDVTWLKDDLPVTKRATISNSDRSSQILVPSSERSDTGIYTVTVKNMVGQDTFSVEVRVTDDPKPPGPVELEENVPGTVTVIWESSPDEKRDNRLHYIVSKRDSTKQSWCTVADRVFNNKATVCNIMHGREYHFRVYAKNDMGISAPSESPTWGKHRRKEKFVVTRPAYKDCDLRSAPAFLVPLKLHNAPKGYECYMSCAVKGNPTPRITWYRNGLSLNANTNYYISDICGVCSMLILRVGPKDTGEYSIVAENSLGRAECSTDLVVRE